MIAEIEKERMIMLNGENPAAHQKNEIDEEDIEARLTRMLGDVDADQQPLL